MGTKYDQLSADERYSADSLQATLGPGYQRLSAEVETHRTPAGNSQDFLWCLFRKGADQTAL